MRSDGGARDTASQRDSTGTGLLRIPTLDPAGRSRVLGQFGGRGPIHLGDDRRRRAFEKSLDAASRRDKRNGEVWERRLADDDEKANAVADHRRELVWLVADAGVVGEGDPFAPTDLRQPVFVRTSGREVIAVSLDGEARALQDLREEGAKVAIGEEDTRQAARS